MAGTEEEAGTVNTAAALSLLLCDMPELQQLSRAGWFKPLGPDRWRTIDIIRGRIRALLDLVMNYSTAQMANALGLSRERVRQLTVEGVLKQSSNGKYNRDETTRAYIIWQRDQNRQANRSTSESRVRDARATEIEIRTAERTRELISLDEALESNALLCGFVRTEFGGLAARVTRDLAVRRDIEKAVNDSLIRIADRLKQEAASLEAGRAPDDAVADDDAGPVGDPQPQLSTLSGDTGAT